jgi:acetyl-CoA carboxylase biotin carboxyl carrier protein
VIKVTAEIPAAVWVVTVEAGQQVTAGQDLVILESMKMEIPVVSPATGVVAAVHVEPAQFVQEGQLLVEIEAAG